MVPLKIDGTGHYPDIKLDKDSGIFEFSGNSLPEDAKGFYEPILNWIEKYAEQPNGETTVRFKMIYYNTPSSKIIYQILKRFEAIALKGYKTKVIWAYNEDDIDIKDAGKDLSVLIKAPFVFESYKD